MAKLARKLRLDSHQRLNVSPSTVRCYRTVIEAISQVHGDQLFLIHMKRHLPTHLLRSQVLIHTSSQATHYRQGLGLGWFCFWDNMRLLATFLEMDESWS
jgi:hypothetical protein